MNVIYILNNNYNLFLKSSLISLLKNRKTNYNLNIYIIIEDHLDDIEEILNLYPNINIIYYKNTSLTFFESMHITSVAYYRLFLADILPQNIKKCLYLDVDTIILSDLYKLYNTDISDYVYAGVLDVHPAHLKEKNYINSGVLLINLETIRNKSYISKYTHFIKNEKIIPFHDQTIINVIHKDQIKLLSSEYNISNRMISRPQVVDMILEKREKYKDISRRDLIINIYRPKIIHFIDKPNFNSPNSVNYEELMWLYLNMYVNNE